MARAISVIIPAFNEELYLPTTLRCLAQALECLRHRSNFRQEIVLVDNASTDGTAAIAATFGARVISIPDHSIARVRNAGAKAATGDVLLFLDADTRIPELLLTRIVEEMEKPTCLGGAVDIKYRPTRPLIRAYLRLWRIIGISLRMAQGAAQFCLREAFDELNGYDETLYMGEDVDFYWRLRKLAKLREQEVCFIRDVRVVPSCRRFDQWPLSRIFVETNPFYISLFRKRKSTWRGWYNDILR